MDTPPSTTGRASTANAEAPLDFDVPVGDHPLEVAARRGIGPMSPVGKRVWHGDSTPCVSCGQLVRRGATECEDCGQDLRDEMLEKMRAHAGPWYVLEHLRPFPGVSLERIIKQIRRGLITETSIVRGPSTDYQWRFAVETPGLCRYFGKCWHCHHDVPPSDTYCPSCLSFLSFEKPSDPRALPRAETMSPAGTLTGVESRGALSTPWPAMAASPGDPRAAPRTVASNAEDRPLGRLSGPATRAPDPASPVRTPEEAVGQAGRRPAPTPAEFARLADAVQTVQHLPRIEGPGWQFGPSWIAAILVLGALLALVWVAGMRSRSNRRAEPPAQTAVQQAAPASADQSVAP